MTLLATVPSLPPGTANSFMYSNRVGPLGVPQSSIADTRA